MNQSIRKTGYHHGSTHTEEIIQINDQVGLRVISFEPFTSHKNMPIIIVTGLSTIIESFDNVLEEITKDFTVYYIETREKPSSQLTGKVRFDIATMGEDIASLVKSLRVQEGQYILMGYSFGATAIADTYEKLTPKPYCLLFVEPTPVFHYPMWSLLLIRWLGVPLYPVVMALAKWYIKKFLTDPNDAEMFQITKRALDKADPVKLTKCILAIAHYQVWERLRFIDCPTLVVGTSKDKFHVLDDVHRMVSSIDNCQYIDMEDNKRSHSGEMGHVIRNFVNSVG